MSSKPGCSSDRAKGRYFGRTLGSPPGLPGGGITGVLPASGVGACIEGSTPAGGQRTPSDFASLSPKGSWLCPVVAPFGAMLPCGVVGVGAQPSARSGAGGATRAGGVAGAGGACALAIPDTANSAHEIKRVSLICMRGKRSARVDVPQKFSGFAVADQ